MRDATKRQRTEQELFRLATHDSLTGLANRALLLDRLDAVRRRRSRQQSPLTVLFLDLDRFKEVNDTHGHAAGDSVLRAVATALTSTFRPADTVARVGGDEFVIMCEDTPLDEGASLARRALEAVRSRVQALPYTAAAEVTASVGAVSAVTGEEAESLIGRADAAMYAAKQRGGDRLLVA
jgi:diguanylate cyclase (GGDEF)-like protein